MRNYEIVTIVNPQLPDDAVPELTERLNQLIVDRGGTIDKVQRWGRRRLAYPIDRHTEAHYVLTRFAMDPDLTSEVEAELRVSEDVLKHMIVRREGPEPDSPEERAEAAPVDEQSDRGQSEDVQDEDEGNSEV